MSINRNRHFETSFRNDILGSSIVNRFYAIESQCGRYLLRHFIILLYYIVVHVFFQYSFVGQQY